MCGRLDGYLLCLERTHVILLVRRRVDAPIDSRPRLMSTSAHLTRGSHVPSKAHGRRHQALHTRLPAFLCVNLGDHGGGDTPAAKDSAGERGGREGA